MKSRQVTGYIMYRTANFGINNTGLYMCEYVIVDTKTNCHPAQFCAGYSWVESHNGFPIEVWIPLIS